MRVPRVSRIEPSRDAQNGIEADVLLGGTSRRLWYQTSGASAPSFLGDTLLTASLLPAMRLGDTLQASEGASPQLIARLPTIQQIFRSWGQRYEVYERYRTICIEAGPRPLLDFPLERGTAAFFSGGVDSFYTFARHASEIDALVFIAGFEGSPHDPVLESDVLPSIRAIAEALNTRLVEVRTNVRAFGEPYVHWDAHHGAALASVAQLLATDFKRMYIPATQTYAFLSPLGSHPLLDPLWSTEELEIVHDGCEASRIQKIEVISTSDVARRSLRVCTEGRRGTPNCGRCEKCLRTMVAMEAVGVLDAFETLPNSVDLQAIGRIDLPEHRYTWDASASALERRNPQLAKALRHKLYSRRARFERRGWHYARRIRRGAVRLLDAKRPARSDRP